MDQRWIKATKEELQALQEDNTWQIVDLPKGKKTVGFKWVVTIKYKKKVCVRSIKDQIWKNLRRSFLEHLRLKISAP